jgi:pyrimidine operon attenuation protein/uracil phosphoribosyltransferase
MELPQYVIEKLESEYQYRLLPIASDALQTVVQETDAVYLTPSQPHQLALFTQVDSDIQSHLSTMVSRVKIDAFYVTRKQKERMVEGSDEAGGDYPRIDEKFLKERRFKNTVVMHPLPRVDELSQEIDKDRRGIYFKQAAYGVPIRMALLKFLLDGSEKGTRRRTGDKFPLFKNPDPLGPKCPNSKCVTLNDPVSTQPRFEVLFSGPGGGLILRCFYCDHRLKVQYMGHTKSKRYCHYDIALGETVQDWLKSGELAIFESIKQAEELGYEPYKIGPQRSLMDEAAIRETIRRMATQLLEETEDPDRLLILGIRSKGVWLAKRIAAQLEKERKRISEVGEIEIYGSGDDLRRLSVDSESSPINLKDREVILVDDVIHTGRTVKSALSIIFKSGRPRSVRLAVLIDRGHRELPVKPNYVGKHIPSSERERVRVKLREVEQNEKDKVVIYSIISPDSDQRSVLSSQTGGGADC